MAGDADVVDVAGLRGKRAGIVTLGIAVVLAAAVVVVAIVGRPWCAIAVLPVLALIGMGVRLVKLPVAGQVSAVEATGLSAFLRYWQLMATTLTMLAMVLLVGTVVRGDATVTAPVVIALVLPVVALVVAQIGYRIGKKAFPQPPR